MELQQQVGQWCGSNLQAASVCGFPELAALYKDPRLPLGLKLRSLHFRVFLCVSSSFLFFYFLLCSFKDWGV